MAHQLHRASDGSSDKTSSLLRSRTDPAAFGDVYRRHARRVIVYIARRVVDAETAADLASESWAVAYSRRTQFRGSSVEQEEAWLLAIARRQLSHYWRRGKTERGMIERLGLEPIETTPSDIEFIERAAALDDLRTHVLKALENLPVDQREAVRRRIMLGESYASMAQVAGVGEQVLRARVSRGLKALHRRVGHLDLEEL